METVVVNGHSIVWFFIGSIFGLASAIWDVWSVMHDRNSGRSSSSLLEGSYYYDPEAWFYQSLVLLAPLFYLFEAVIEIVSSSSSSSNRGSRGGDGHPIGNNFNNLRWQDVFFGIGATCELTAASLAILMVDNTAVSSLITKLIGLLSTHAYGINGAMGLLPHCRSGSRTTTMTNHNVTNLQDLLFLGDMLFGLGASIDLILSYLAVLSLDWPVCLASANLISAICWCSNAVLYILAWRWQYYHHHADDGDVDDDITDNDLETPLLLSSSNAVTEHHSQLCCQDHSSSSSGSGNTIESGGSMRHRTAAAAKSISLDNKALIMTAPRWIREHPQIV